MTLNDLLPILAAPFAGSLAGVLARRLPRGQPVVFARSACETCHTALTAADLVPLVSYAALRGRCRHCGAPIGRYHPAMELAATAVALWAAAVYTSALLWVSCLLGWMLLTLAVCDAISFRLPDALTLPLILMGLAVTGWLTPAAAGDHALAAALGYIAFRGIAAGYRLLRKRDGLGQGDAKLLAACGAWLGLAALPDMVLGAALAGLAYAAIIAWRGGGISARTRLPFGPCLAGATWMAWLYA